MTTARTTAALALALTAAFLGGCATAPADVPEPGAVTASEAPAASSPTPTPTPTFEIGQKVSVEDREVVRAAGLGVYEDRKGRGWVWDPASPGMPPQAIRDLKAIVPVYAGRTLEPWNKASKEIQRISAQMLRQYPVMVTQGGSYDEGGNLLHLNGWGMAGTGPLMEYGETWPTREAAIAGVKAKIAAADNPEWYIYIDLD